MFKKYFLPALSIAGAIFGLFIVSWSQKSIPVPPILFQPSSSPYDHPIAGTGIIEASTENISIASPFNGIIAKVYVSKGDNVKVGDPLFELDLRELYALQDSAKAALNLATVTYENATEQFGFYDRLIDKRAVSKQSYQQAYYSMLQAKENVKVAEANLRGIEVNIERSIIKAPIDGQVLQVNCHAGEIAPAIPVTASQSTWRTAANGGLILLGNVSRLQVRIDIDADDAWRYSKGAPATAFVRGNRDLTIPLTFAYMEPYVIPKSSFTGQTIERVDTRVLQVLYQFEKNNFPVYPGQILDVYIEVKPGGQ